MKQIKEYILGLVSILVLLFVVVATIAHIRSTEETYVCSGTHTTPSKHPKHVTVEFKIENNQPGLPWLDSNWGNVSFNPPDTFDTIYSSKYSDGSKFNWSEDVYGRDMSIFVSSNSIILDFKFKTKILNVIHYVNDGNTRRSEYNLLCSVAK
jgi:hypothetical protein